MNLPNALTALRLVASPALAVLALSGRGDLFLYVFLILEVTDWLDGRLAVLLDQQSEFGARLDSVADMVMYGLLLGGLLILEWQLLRAEWFWIALVPTTYAASWGASMVKFGRMPSYHTRTAKATYFLVIGATAGLLVLDLAWPVRVATAAAALTNLESVAITMVLDTPRSDVASLIGVLEEERARTDGEGVA